MSKILKKGAGLFQKQVRTAHAKFYDFFNPYRFRVQEAFGMSTDSSINICGISFLNLHETRHKDSLIGISADKKFIIKLALKRNQKKRNSVLEEAGIINKLAGAECLTSPDHVLCGELSQEEKKSFIFPNMYESVLGEYFIMPYYPTKEFGVLGDVILAVIEQRRLGVFHADLKPNNFRMGSSHAVLIDYDQAELISESLINSTNAEFFKWANELIYEKYKKEHIFSDFTTLPFEKIYLDHFIDDAFNLTKTSLFKGSQSTRAENGVYHTIQNSYVYARGVRDLDSRTELLNKITIMPREKFLDIGCNTGLLSFYLHNRGADVIGVDIDVASIEIAQLVSHITDKNVNFRHMDIDKIEKIDPVDTVCIFSVLHHTKNVQKNALKIANACQRILIECRLKESGAKPANSTDWQRTSSWSFETADELVNYLEFIFPTFRVVKNYGLGDKGRHIYELIKGV